MQEVRIRKFETRYRLPQSAPAERHRLDRIRAAVLEEALELAIERADIAPEVFQEGELCLRRVYVPVRLRLTGTDAGLAVNWGVALAEEIARALRDGATANAVFYHSRRQAVMDLAEGVARGDLGRTWAWRQLGLWHAGEQASESDAVFELAQTLCAEPTMILPALRAVAAGGRLARIARNLTARQWSALAFAALSQTGAARLVDRPDQQHRKDVAPSSWALRAALRVLNQSDLLRAAIASGAIADIQACRSIAALAALEVEPALLRAEAAPSLIAIIAEAIGSARNQAPTLPSEEPELGAAKFAAQSAEDDLGYLPGAPIEQDEESEPCDLRQRGFTHFGGLLFLLGVIEELRLPEEILAHARLGARPFRWTMHQLALALVEAVANDAAALAFAGLSPEATPPSDAQKPPDEIEASAIESLAARIVARLRLMLELHEEPERALLEFVCLRRVEIVADPGWIDIRLSLDSVTTEIRRAGLDLNPGYVSWLGVVVRFVYE